MAPHRLALCALLTVGCSASPPIPKPVSTPLDWHPQLDQPIRQLQELLASTEQQQPRNYISSNLAFVLDAKPYLLFERYLNWLPARQRADAIEEQRAWLGKRKLVSEQAYSEYEGGTLASSSGNEAFLEATQARIIEVNRRIAPPATKPMP